MYVSRIQFQTLKRVNLERKYVLEKGSKVIVKEPTIEFFNQAMILARRGYIVGKFWYKNKSDWKHDGF